MGYGQGYDGQSKSWNAVDAEDRGEFPASVCARKLAVPVKVVKWCREARTDAHHTSSYYRRTMYYDLDALRYWLSAPEGQAALAEVRAEKRAERKASSQVHENCKVEWLEWSGPRDHPKSTRCRAEGARVEVKGQTATITLADGQTFRKRVTTRGFDFRSV